jgi:hypothetical protein
MLADLRLRFAVAKCQDVLVAEGVAEVQDRPVVVQETMCLARECFPRDVHGRTQDHAKTQRPPDHRCG